MPGRRAVSLSSYRAPGQVSLGLDADEPAVHDLLIVLGSLAPGHWATDGRPHGVEMVYRVEPSATPWRRARTRGSADPSASGTSRGRATPRPRAPTTRPARRP